jgi:hypothetical protein
MRTLILITALALGTTAARADNAFWYVGAGVGSNSWSINVAAEGIPAPPGYGGFPADLNTTSWKAYGGVRPLKWLAGELDYIDLGTGSGRFVPDVHGKAVGAYAVGFLPIPVVDVFGKVGVARWQLNGTVIESARGPTYASPSSTGTGFAWGIGVQAHISMVGARLEYEGFTVPRSSGPRIASLSVFFSF